MEFRVLGPLEVHSERGALALGGPKTRAVLAVLLLHPNEPVSWERLALALWGEDTPINARKTVQVHVSRLRKALGDADILARRPAGYQLRVRPGELDAERFERFLEEGRHALAEGRAEHAAAVLREALALWRGSPLAELTFEAFAQAEIARLEEQRVAALEARVEADLAAGTHAALIGELQLLVAEHPTRERLAGQLMLALYRCERQADALQVYQDARRALVEELGIEPGEGLRGLERAILAQDPALAASAAPVSRDAADAMSPVSEAGDLPTGVVTFLLTDIEGSSGLWEDDLEGMAAALELHEELIAQTVSAHGGQLLKTKGEGDATLTVFRRASDAVTGAVALQEALGVASWPGELELRVRIALHTGEAHERAGDYFGPALNRAARLRGLARGGAIVVSQATAEIVRDRMPADAELVHLGRQELRGLARPENVFEVRPVGAETVAPAPQVMRKTVTVLFSSVSASSRRDERLDPEVHGRVISRCFEDMHPVLKRHGGTAEAYPGDALMAVFGVPLLHEDDALRAVRAASEMREALRELRDELERTFGVRLAARFGVGTGEAIAAGTATGETLVTGEAVNVAKGLEELATDGEIFIDELTYGLVRGAVTADRARHHTSRSGEPIAALRVVEVHPEAIPRASRLDSPLVGRDRHLDTLSRVFAAAVSDRTCHLVTLLGAAGVGKSRLVREVLGRLGDQASVLRGRCLPYGEGITYWPLAEVVRDMTNEQGSAEPSTTAIAAQLAGDPKAELVVAGLAQALGLGGAKGGTSERIFWATRRLLEAVARRRPLVVVFDDLHWAEPTILDLIEYVTDLSRGAPIVILCLARPELLEGRPGWGGGKLNATSVLLEPLSEDDTKHLIANLLSRGTLPADATERIADASGGNPLFAEELLSMLIEDGLLRRENGGWTVADEVGELPVPPTIHALLAARLERLPENERALLAHASIEGTVFHRGALDELAPGPLRAVVEGSLTSLVRRDMICPDRASFAEDEAYRFRHILIRDAGYRSLSKEMRAALHERFANWLEQTAGSRLGEFEEIAGYHLEQACRLLSELGVIDSDAEVLAVRGAERLESAGRKAHARSDHTGAVSLLERAAALLPDDHARRTKLLLDLGSALMEAGRLMDADEVLGEAGRLAAATGDERSGAHVLVQQQFLRLHRRESSGTAEAAAVVGRVVPVFQRADDEYGLCDAFRLRASLHWMEAHAAASSEAWEQAAEHARRAGAEHERIEILGWLASAHWWGPTPVGEAIRRCDAIRGEVSGSPAAVAYVLHPLAGLHAMEGRFDHARELQATGVGEFEELGLTLTFFVSHTAAYIELLAGNAVAAEQSLRRGYQALEDMGDKESLSATAALLARALLAQRRDEEAERFAGLSQELAPAADLIAQVFWRGARARTLAARGLVEEAERLAREAVALAKQSDFVNDRGDAVFDLAVVHRQTRRLEHARAAFAEAHRLYVQKGNVVAAGRAQAELAGLVRV